MIARSIWLCVTVVLLCGSLFAGETPGGSGALTGDVEVLPVGKELWERLGKDRIKYTAVVPPAEGVSEAALAGVELLTPASSRVHRHPFRKSNRELLLYEKTLIEHDLSAEEQTGGSGTQATTPPVGTGPTYQEKLKAALQSSDLMEKVERELPSGRRTTAWVLKKGRERDRMKLAFKIARAHIWEPKNILDRELTIEAEVTSATGLVCDPPYKHHDSQGWAYVVDAYLKDEPGDFAAGLNRFLDTRGVGDWRVQKGEAPTWDNLVALIEQAQPVVLFLREPIHERRYVTVLGIVRADKALIISLPTAEVSYYRTREVAPWGTKLVRWNDLRGRTLAGFSLTQVEPDGLRQDKEEDSR